MPLLATFPASYPAPDPRACTPWHPAHAPAPRRPGKLHPGHVPRHGERAREPSSVTRIDPLFGLGAPCPTRHVSPLWGYTASVLAPRSNGYALFHSARPGAPRSYGSAHFPGHATRPIGRMATAFFPSALRTGRHPRQRTAPMLHTLAPLVARHRP
jgi:hypothetical protein